MVIGSQEKKVIEICLNNAEKSRIPAARMAKISKGNERPIGNDPKLVCSLRGEFQVAFSIEEHSAGWVRHISVSAGGYIPLAEDFESIAKEFKFQGTLKDYDKIWIEHLAQNIYAMNAVQKIASSS